MQESEENRLTAASVEAAWNASDVLQADVEVDLDTEFAALESLMDEDDSEIKKAPKQETVVKEMKPSTSSRRTWLSIAAGLLLLATAAFFFRNAIVEDTPIASAEWRVITTEAETYTATLPDQSKVYLNKGSQLSYPETFQGKNRLLKLEGEAFFDVSHNPKKPFVVETIQENITVLGTSFNVQTQEEGLTTVYVATGKVQVAQKTGQDKIVLTQGEQGISNAQSKEIINLGKQSPNAIAWHSQHLVFVETPLLKVLEQVEQVYGVTITCTNKDIFKCGFTSTFKRQKIETILETLQTVLDVKVEEISENEYRLSGGSC